MGDGGFLREQPKVKDLVAFGGDPLPVKINLSGTAIMGQIYIVEVQELINVICDFSIIATAGAGRQVDDLGEKIG